ncbi:MAG: acyltransferase family protein, partial [Lachnospiraceae bacterium]|nr:acyltransferase family protein [Lachnospiraceae bacterium]
IFYNFVVDEFILKRAPADSSGIGWPRYLFLISTWIPADKNFWVNLCSTWTVGIFVLFYLLVPLMKRFIMSLKGAWLLWGGLYLLSLLCLGKVQYGMPVFYLHYFVMGIVFYFANKEGKERELIIGCVAFVLGSVAVNHTLTLNACSMLFLILIIMAKEIRIENDRLQRVVNMMDAYSYTIYLTHAVVMDGIEMLKNRYTLSQNMILIIGVGCTVAGCFVARHLVEIPMEKLGKKCLMRVQ